MLKPSKSLDSAIWMDPEFIQFSVPAKLCFLYLISHGQEPINEEMVGYFHAGLGLSWKAIEKTLRELKDWEQSHQQGAEEDGVVC